MRGGIGYDRDEAEFSKVFPEVSSPNQRLLLPDVHRTKPCRGSLGGETKGNQLDWSRVADFVTK